MSYFFKLLNSGALSFTRPQSSWFDKYEPGISTRNADSVLDLREAVQNEGVVIQPYFGHCWTMLATPKNEMWFSDNQEKRHIAICTTFQALQQSIGRDDILAGEITYRKFTDFDRFGLSEIAQYFHKDDSYSDQRELRLLVKESRKSKLSGHLLKIPVDLNFLIQGLIVARGVENSKYAALLKKLSQHGLEVSPTRFG